MKRPGWGKYLFWGIILILIAAADLYFKPFSRGLDTTIFVITFLTGFSLLVVAFTAPEDKKKPQPEKK